MVEETILPLTLRGAHVAVQAGHGGPHVEAPGGPASERGARSFYAVRPPRRVAAPYEDARRKEQRFGAVVDQLWMQWWENGDYLGLTARLINVSRAGALILSPRLLHPEQEVRLFLEDTEPQVGIDAVVLGALEGKRGTHQVRLRFKAHCPDAFFDAAAFGFEAWLARHGTSR